MADKDQESVVKKEEDQSRSPPPNCPVVFFSMKSQGHNQAPTKFNIVEKSEPKEDPLRETTISNTQQEIAYQYEQRMIALIELDLKKVFICCCPSSNTIFFSEDDYLTHVFAFHEMHWFPNSTHLNKRKKVSENKHVDKELLSYFKQEQIKQMLEKLERRCLRPYQFETYDMERRKQILKPLKFRKNDEGLMRNLNMNSLFYLQELKKSKWIKKRLYDANYQYCTLCRQFIMHNHHREINEPFIIKHMKKHRSNKIFKTTNLQTELKSEIQRMKEKKQELFVCGCSSEKFPGPKQLQNHIWRYHQGQTPRYSSHKLVDDELIKNTAFPQEKVMQNCMLPELYICGFCYEASKGVILFHSPSRYITHLKSYHPPPYYHAYNSHFLQECYKIEQYMFPTQVPHVQPSPSRSVSQKSIEETLELLEKAEQKFMEEFRCNRCKETFPNKQRFLDYHFGRYCKKEQSRHFAATDCVVVQDGDRNIVLPSNMAFVSEAYQKKLVPYLCGCKEESCQLRELVLHLKKKHDCLLAINNQ